MPRSTSEPVDEADEVLDVYTGDTLEEAMAEAVAALGAGLEVRRARKVRAGVRGLMGKQVYEVLAVAGPAAASPPSAPSEDPLQDAVARLLEQAEAQETGGRPAAQPQRVGAQPQRVEAQPQQQRAELRLDERLLHEALAEHEALHGPVGTGAGPAGPAAAPAARQPGAGPAAAPLGVATPGQSEIGSFADELDVAQQARRPVAPPVVEATVLEPDDVPGADATRERPRLEPRSERRAAVRPRRLVEAPVGQTDGRGARTIEGSTVATRRRPLAAAPHPDLQVSDHAASARPVTARRSPTRAAGWSRTGLSRLGLPGRVLAALPPDDPADDLAWLVAVTAAIASCVPAPAPAGPEHPVVIDGHGLAGALAILEAGCRGATPGTISSGGRVVDATAMELALVLHASLTGAAS